MIISEKDGFQSFALTIRFDLDLLSQELANNLVLDLIDEGEFSRDNIAPFQDGVTLIDSKEKDVDTATNLVTFEKATLLIARIKSCEFDEWTKFRKRIVDLVIKHATKRLGEKRLESSIKSVDNRLVLEILKESYAQAFISELLSPKLLNVSSDVSKDTFSSFSVVLSSPGNDPSFGLSVSTKNKRAEKEVVQIVVGYPWTPATSSQRSISRLEEHWAEKESTIVNSLGPLLSRAVLTSK